MRLFFKLLLAGALGSFLSFAQRPITLIVIHGKIWTGNPAQPEAEAIAVSGGQVVAVGAGADLLKLRSSRTHVIDAEGKRIVPGFNDAHVHLLFGGQNLTGPQLRHTRSQAEFRDTLRDFVRQKPAGQWVTGGNWDHENWSPAVLPTHQLIDAVTDRWPVFVSRLDGHMALANSVALKLAGIDRQTKDVPGGVIVRDASGEPTGILKDAAQDLVFRVIPPPAPVQMRAAILAAQAYANANGVTSVQDMSAAPEVFRVYQQMLHADELHIRISGHQPLPSWQNLANVGLVADFGNPGLHIGGLKGFADGSLGSTTALFFAPYLDSPQTTGITSAELANPDQMFRNIEGADAAGLQIAIHAIGDKANNTILNFYERVEQEHGARDRRFRIEHAQHLLASDIPRFAKLQVVASMQPYHAIDDGRWAEKRIGPDRAKTTYAFRSLLDAGAVLAFGSDWDVAPMVPLMGIYAAVTRRTLDGQRPGGWVPEQKITVAEAVRAYTAGSAYASFEEKIKGTLEPGKLADFAVLSDDIFSLDPVKIADARIELTVVNGEIVYDRKSSAPPRSPQSGAGSAAR